MFHPQRRCFMFTWKPNQGKTGWKVHQAVPHHAAKTQTSYGNIFFTKMCSCVLWWGYKYCAVRWNLLISKLAAMQNNPSIFTLNYAPWTLMGLTPSKIVFRIGPLVDTLDFLLLHNLELLLNHETVLRLCLISLWLQKKGYHFFSTNFCILFFKWLFLQIFVLHLLWSPHHMCHFWK